MVLLIYLTRCRDAKEATVEMLHGGLFPGSELIALCTENCAFDSRPPEADEKKTLLSRMVDICRRVIGFGNKSPCGCCNLSCVGWKFMSLLTKVDSMEQWRCWPSFSHCDEASGSEQRSSIGLG